jgi:SAM-dependent methyltransferase
LEPRERSLYEVAENWDRFTLTPVLAEKARVLDDLIPAGTGRTLDLACGNGLITHLLAERHPIVGLDWSLAALRLVRVPRICASATALPLRAGAFDLVLCSELLEHLTDADLEAARAETARLAPRYLLLSVPREENLRLNALRCARCGRVFNASYHRRAFSAANLAALFPGYRTVARRTGGTGVRRYPPALLRLRQTLGRRWFQLPATRTAVCPGCGNRDFPRTRPNPISLLCDGLNRLISRRRPYWLYLCWSETRPHHPFRRLTPPPRVG